MKSPFKNGKSGCDPVKNHKIKLSANLVKEVKTAIASAFAVPNFSAVAV